MTTDEMFVTIEDLQAQMRAALALLNGPIGAAHPDLRTRLRTAALDFLRRVAPMEIAFARIQQGYERDCADVIHVTSDSLERLAVKAVSEEQTPEGEIYWRLEPTVGEHEAFNAAMRLAHASRQSLRNMQHDLAKVKHTMRLHEEMLRDLAPDSDAVVRAHFERQIADQRATVARLESSLKDTLAKAAP